MRNPLVFKRLFAALAGLGLFILLHACDVNGTIDVNNDKKYSASDPINLRVAVAGHTAISVDNVNGPVEISGVSGLSEIEITGERIVRSSSLRDADDHLQYLQFNLRDVGTTFVIETDQPTSDDKREYEVRFKIRIPRDWDVSVDLANGIVSVDSIIGNANIDVTNGNVNLTSVIGTVNVDLTNGNADLRDIDGDVEVDLTNGIIFTQMNFTLNRTCQLQTVNGGIELQIPKTTSADFTASVANGEITMRGLTLSDAASTPRSMHGTLGNGEGQIKLKTTNGSILAVGY